MAGSESQESSKKTGWEESHKRLQCYLQCYLDEGGGCGVGCFLFVAFISSIEIEKEEVVFLTED